MLIVTYDELLSHLQSMMPGMWYHGSTSTLWLSIYLVLVLVEKLLVTLMYKVEMNQLR